jgi:hypothetical protein
MNARTVIPLVDLNGRIKFPNVMRAEARDYRREHNTGDAGVVVFHGTELQGWVNALRNPESWVPGCVAVDNEGNFFEARGGNDYDGAREWVRVRS